MAKTISTAKTNPIRPFYAAVGGVDVAVALARTGLSDVQTRLAKVDLEPKALVDDLNKQYVDLALRGRNLVGRIRRQQATQDLKVEADKTSSKAKTTRTQARNATSTVKSSTKATGTSAKKATAAAGKATVAAAAKTGTTGV